MAVPGAFKTNETAAPVFRFVLTSPTLTWMAPRIWGTEVIAPPGASTLVLSRCFAIRERLLMN